MARILLRPAPRPPTPPVIFGSPSVPVPARRFELGPAVSSPLAFSGAPCSPLSLSSAWSPSPSCAPLLGYGPRTPCCPNPRSCSGSSTSPPHHFSPMAPGSPLPFLPALCSSLQSLRCSVPGHVCVVVFFRGNTHFAVVLRSLLGSAWVLVVGQTHPVSFVLSSSFGHLTLTCVHADKGIPRRCREASTWSIPQVLGERLEQESSSFMRSSS
jgi:hypothetical protein